MSPSAAVVVTAWPAQQLRPCGDDRGGEGRPSDAESESKALSSSYAIKIKRLAFIFSCYLAATCALPRHVAPSKIESEKEATKEKNALEFVLFETPKPAPSSKQKMSSNASGH